MSTLNVSNITDGTTTVGTEYVVNGSAKAWVNFNGGGTIAARDSLNVSSLTDNSTGYYTTNFSSGMGNTGYSLSVQIGGGGSRNWANSPISNRTSSSADIFTYNTSGAATDYDSNNKTFHGDLA